jgi:hypothetical protein
MRRWSIAQRAFSDHDAEDSAIGVCTSRETTKP